MKQTFFLITIGLLFVLNTQAQQQIRTYTANEEDSMACIQNYSLYTEFVKQENYKDALPGWRNAVKLCPKMAEAHWQYGVKIMEWHIENTEDEALKEKYIDTLLWVYDKRIEHFGNEGYVLEQKGVDMMKMRKDEPEKANVPLMKAVELRGNELGPAGALYAYKSVYDMYRLKKADKQLLFELYPTISDVISHNIKNGDDRLKSAYETAQKNVDKMFENVAECPELVEYYTVKFSETPKDAEMLKRILYFFEKQDCTDEELYLKAAVNLYELEPAAEAAYAIGNGYAKKEQYSEAAEYYKKALETEDEELKLKALNKAANTSLLTGNYQAAKSYALQILQINPNDGEAYITIGNAYVKGKSACGGNECTNRAAYWAAVDKFYTAKSVDPSVAEKAQKLINTYSAQFPKKEDCFFHSLSDGDDYKLDCWIGETTKVRTRAN